MSCRIQKGGWANAPPEGFVDLIDFHNRFLLKASANYDGVIVDQSAIPSGGDVTSSLIVIDMQKDFVDKDGAFSVADGVQMEPKLVEFIKTNIHNFTKVIFSRDSHDANHCSFKAFPPHCVINSKGGQLTEAMKTLVAELKNDHSEKLDVIFKGMFPTTDSFGALNYPANNYAPTRQVGECKTDRDYLKETGGFYLNTTDTSKKFSDTPFDGGNTYDMIKGELKTEKTEKFQVAHLFPDQTSGKHNVFIVGLAGDFCAKDTAMNIAKQAKNGSINGVDVNVFVIQPFVRYPFVPISFLKELNDLVKIESNKPLNNYVFKFTETGNKKLLTSDEIKTRFDGLFHFLTDPSDLLKDYKNAGVKMIMDVPQLTTSTNVNAIAASTNVNATAASTNVATTNVTTPTNGAAAAAAAATTGATTNVITPTNVKTLTNSAANRVAKRQQTAFHKLVEGTRKARGLPPLTKGGKRRCKKMRTRKQRRHRK